jgi:hypothetical protein
VADVEVAMDELFDDKLGGFAVIFNAEDLQELSALCHAAFAQRGCNLTHSTPDRHAARQEKIIDVNWKNRSVPWSSSVLHRTGVPEPNERHLRRTLLWHFDAKSGRRL